MAKGGSGSLKVKKYYLSILYSFCLGPIDYIKEIRFDDKTVATGTFTDGTLTINNEELYGGMDREGGVSGNIDIMLGYPTQTVNSYYAAKFPNPPAFRGLVTVLLKDFYVGMNYYLKPFSAVATKIRATRDGINTWQPAYIEPIPGQMNGVHILRDLLISSDGMGIDSSKIGNSFSSAAVTCFNEGLGFSFFFRDAKDISNYIDIVKAHINAEMYLDRITGKYEIKLIRQDYNINTITRLTKTNVKEIPSLKRSLLGELFSKVTIKYINGATFKEAVHIEEDFSLSNLQGGPVEKNIDFIGCSNRDLAAKLAARELKEVSTPTFAGEIIGDTTLANLNIGDAFIIDKNCNPYCDFDIVCRVAGMDFGTSTDHKVKITFIEDIFASQESFQFSAPETGWVDVFNPPVPVAKRLMVEAPYYVIAQLVGDAEAKNIDTTDCYLLAAGVQPNIDCSLAHVYVNGVSKNNTVLHFCPYGLLANPITKTDTTITLTSTSNVFLFKPGSFINIDNEIIGIVSSVVNIFTVVRGCLDSVPETHNAGAEAWGWEHLHGADGVPYFNGETLSVKLTTATPKQELTLGDVPTDTITMFGKMHLPYPPGNLQINEVIFPNVSLVSLIDMVFTWAGRNRFTQTVDLIGYFTGNITSEAGVTYSGELRRTDTNGILYSFTGETLLTRTISLITLPSFSSITYSGLVATATTVSAHGLITGQKVFITSTSPGQYSGIFVVTVTSSTTFTYILPSNPGSNATVLGAAKRSIYSGQVKFTLWSVNANGASWQKVNHIFNLE